MAGGAATEVNVKDELLVDEMVINVAVGILEPHGGSSPGVGIRLVRLNVGGDSVPGPTVDFDVVFCPFKSVCGCVSTKYN